VDLWKSGQLTICLSRPITNEYIEILQRLELKNERELNEILSLFGHGFHVLFSAKTPKLHLIEEDPDDDNFI